MKHQKTLTIALLTAALMSTTANAADFDWRKFEGTEITWAYDIHPYADAVVAYLPEFEELTGIKVNAELYPDDTYWGKLNIQLSTGSPDWDVVGTGIQPAWDVTPGGQLAPLKGMIADPTMTNPEYDYEDFFPALREAWTWNVSEEKIIADPNGEVWGIPHAFENMQMMYRTDILERLGVEVPGTLPELTEACKVIRAADPDITPMAVRGVRFWSSIHTAPISIAQSYGVSDFTGSGDDFDTALDSAESIRFHNDYVDMIQNCAPDSWANDNWYQVVDGLSTGKTAMAVDANMFGFWNNIKGASDASGKIAFAPPPTAPDNSEFASNIWIWSLAINNASEKKDAAWYFIQWATSKEMNIRGATDGKLVNPPRSSTWKAQEWIDYANQPEFNNFYDNFNLVQEKTSLLFTPRYGFGTAMNAWAVAMQEMVGGADIEERLAELAEEIREDLN
ncbi:ABC transporter substrate-binding protein [Pararhizobium sp. IMCC21322]|uniref:ABC transporter substrate-binding protein n=1 Tax=Pararhizobium sp. IMCC21322 TaxID=3067903 RepID=UPI002742240C|nr:extracellular solute-binding protein [Pararhizobium sp. IMCC21322]